MSYEIGTHVELNADGSLASGSKFQGALEITEQEDRPQFTFTSSGRLVRHIPVVTI